MLCKRCLNLSGEYINPIKPDTLYLKESRIARMFSP